MIVDPPELRFGRYQDVLADVECDALICDPPYSERTHAGHDDGTGSINRSDVGRPKADGRIEYGAQRRALNYGAWGEGDVRAFVEWWDPRVRGWFVSLTDHALGPVWERELARTGRYVFSPLACVERGSRVRLTGDGPCQWSTWCYVARPRALHKWGSLPGAYIVPPGAREVGAARKAVIGGKPLWLMQALVRDYSRPGDLICDPCAGGGTTLLAAAMEGRRAVGAEAMPEHYELARKRLARGYTPPLFTEDPSEVIP